MCSASRPGTPRRPAGSTQPPAGAGQPELLRNGCAERLGTTTSQHLSVGPRLLGGALMHLNASSESAAVRTVELSVGQEPGPPDKQTARRIPGGPSCGCGECQPSEFAEARKRPGTCDGA